MIFKIANATIGVNGQELDLIGLIHSQEELARSSEIADGWQAYTDKLIGQTVTFSWAVDPVVYRQLYRLLVGTARPYPLRQLHQNLARYTRWPFTN